MGLPQVSASAQYTNMLEIPTQLVPAEFFGGQPGQFAEVQFGTQHNATFGISATQLIFSGEYIVGLQASRTFMEISERQMRQTQAQAKAQVADAYLLAAMATANRQQLEATLATTRQLMQETQALYQAGFVEQTDVDQLELTTRNLENAVASMRRQEDVALRLFKFQMALPMDSQVEFAQDLQQLQASQAASEAPRQLDLNSHISYQLLESQKAFSLLAERRQKSLFLPTLAAFYSYERNAQRDEFNFGDPDLPWFPTSIIGLKLDVPILSSGARRSQLNQARIEVQKIENSQQMLAMSLSMEADQANGNLATAQEKLANEAQNVALAQRIQERTQAKFKEGMASSLELTQAQNQLLQAQTNYNNALYEVLKAQNALRLALGEY